MKAIDGISGTLFPGQYLADQFAGDRRALGDPVASAAALEAHRSHFARWWLGVEAQCGPATGMRALFDLVAMPLFGRLRFTAGLVTFHRSAVHVVLDAGNAPVALLLLPWSERPSSTWKQLAELARECGARWGFVLAPPYLSLVDLRGHAMRRSVDFHLPDASAPASFSIFWPLAHAAGFRADQNATPAMATSAAAIDRAVESAARFEDAVRTDLQDGVIRSLAALLSAVPARARRTASTSRFDEALTIVYRVLFLLFAESRDLVPHRHPMYRNAYALARLCAEAIDSPPAAGLWEALAAITRLARRGCRADDLIVTPFNGHLFAREAAPSLESSVALRGGTRPAGRDVALHETLRLLSSRASAGGRQRISYRDLGVEQLGSVYERVLDVDPDRPADLLDRPGPTAARHSNRRKESGTFYTPRALCEFVVRRTLAPLVAGASTDRILSLRVVDPAMGSGAFLVAACRFLAGAYEHAAIDEGRPGAASLDDAARADIRRLVAERCLTGVDVNPVAVQLARLSLWLATLAEGKPLGFLDHQLRVGNSLLGASPDDLARLPSRRSGAVRELTLPLFEDRRLETSIRRHVGPLARLLATRDDTVEDVHAKAALWSSLHGSRAPLHPWRSAVSLWCARWFWPGAPPSPAETRAAIDALLKGDATLPSSHLARMLATAVELERTHKFFHWPLEFADVFYDDTGEPKAAAGFDAVIGNPPWEMVRDDSSSKERETGRRLVPFLRESGLYPACNRGHLNLYQPFVERALALARPGGRVGVIVPWGLAVDEGAVRLRERLLDRSSIDTIVGLDNAAALFPIHRGLRFMTIVTTAGGETREIRGRFGVRTARELTELPGADDDLSIGERGTAWPVRMSRTQLGAIGGRSRRIPDFRRPHDVVLLQAVVNKFPAAGSAAGSGLRFGRELNATDDRGSFGAIGLPVIDGKHIQPFAVAHRFSARRVTIAEAARLLPDRRYEKPRLGYRDVSAVGNKLSLIAAIVPAGVVTTHTLFCLRTPVPSEQQHFLCGVFNSYVLNAVVRMLMGGHLTTGLVESLPVPPWRGTALDRRIARLARRIARTSSGAPRLRARLQAAVARLYEVDGGMFERILAGFPLVPSEERQAALVALAAHEKGRQPV